MMLGLLAGDQGYGHRHGNGMSLRTRKYAQAFKDISSYEQVANWFHTAMQQRLRSVELPVLTYFMNELRRLSSLRGFSNGVNERV